MPEVLEECTTCEATGYVYVGFGENDVKECTKCENGYIEVKTRKELQLNTSYE